MLWNPKKYACFCIFPLEFRALVVSRHIRTVGFHVKTAIIHQSKCLCVPDCTYMESIVINFIHLSLYKHLPCRLFYVNMAVLTRLRCYRHMQQTWSQIVATPYTGFRILWPTLAISCMHAIAWLNQIFYNCAQLYTCFLYDMKVNLNRNDGFCWSIDQVSVYCMSHKGTP